MESNKIDFFSRIWDSPTIMTWLSYSTRAISLFGVLPLVLKQFPAPDVVLWYMFMTVISLQSLADFGFRQTFARIISYAFNGAESIGRFLISKEKPRSGSKPGQPNIQLLNKIFSTMRGLYRWLTVVLLLLMVTLGTWVMIKPVRDISLPSEGWISWILIIIVTCVSFYSKIYTNFLEGLFKIALVRRVEAFTSLGAIFTSFLVLLFAPSILNLVIANQFWVLVSAFRDWYLSRSVNNGILISVSKRLPFDRHFFLQIWEPAWRSGISGFMSVGLINLTGLAYAQFGSTMSVASYLLAIRIVNQIRDISMAPFYSKIPLLAKFRVNNDMQSLISTVRKGMFMSHFVFVLGVIVVGLFSDSLLRIIKSNVEFVSAPMWILLSFAFFMHRYGAMHMQVYLTTNHIISHIADGVSGAIYIIACYILIRYIGEYAIPLSMLLGYMGFYTWYAAFHSYKTLSIGFWQLECRTIALPLLMMFTYLCYVLWL